MNLALWVSQNALWICLIVIILIIAWKALNWYADNESKIEKKVNKIRRLFNKNGDRKNKGTTEEAGETKGNNQGTVNAGS